MYYRKVRGTIWLKSWELTPAFYRLRNDGTDKDTTKRCYSKRRRTNNCENEGWGYNKLEDAIGVGPYRIPCRYHQRTNVTYNCYTFCIRRGKQNGNSLQIEIYSPYIILNKSSKPISFCFRDSSYSFKSVVSKHTVPACGSKVQFK